MANQKRGSIQSKTLLGLLERGVRDDKIFCPISAAVFIEIMRQESQSSRIETANLVDQLSLGIAFIGLEERIHVEIGDFIRSTVGLYRSHLPEHLVWRKLGYVFGVHRMPSGVLDPATDVAVQKAFFDHMSSMSLRDMMEAVGNTTWPEEDRQLFVTRMNRGIVVHSDELRSFQQAYDAEVRGIVDDLGGVVVDVLQSIVRDQGVASGEMGSDDRSATENRWKNVLHIALTRNKARKLLPTVNIQASLYGSLRWNKGRNFRANDLWDFSHATAALGYCDAFFTESSLHTMVTQRHVALDKLYECRVASSVDDAIVCIMELLE